MSFSGKYVDDQSSHIRFGHFYNSGTLDVHQCFCLTILALWILYVQALRLPGWYLWSLFADDIDLHCLR